MAERNPRTSIYVKPDVAALAKAWCEKNKRSMSFLVDAAIRAYLRKENDGKHREGA